MPFISMFHPPSDNRKPGWWFIFEKDRMLVRGTGAAAEVPFLPGAEPPGIHPGQLQFLGMMDETPCYVAAIHGDGCSPIEGMRLQPLRRLFGLLPEEHFRVALRASQIMHWDRTSRFCGQCGKPARLSATERAKVCTACGFTTYPRLSPAVIVAVVRDDRILLAHCSRFAEGLYSVLAGFVEPGETLEECVAREVREETGIEIADIRYFRSQPWPFPDSLMLAFTARYAGGEIKVDGMEVTEAAWYSADRLPLIPDKISVARSLIDWFTESRRKGA